MNQRTESPAMPATAAAKPTLGRLRRASMGTLVLVLIQYVIGMYVNLYVEISPSGSDGFGHAISEGPGPLTTHAVFGVTISLLAIGVIVLAIRARHRVAIVASVVGVIALGGADSAGSNFVKTGHEYMSMTMAALSAIAMLCYAALLYLARPSDRRG